MDSKIYVRYGEDGKIMVKKLLEVMKIENFIPSNALIAIKPNLVNSSVSSNGATTDPKIIEGIIEYLLEKGCPPDAKDIVEFFFSF